MVARHLRRAQGGRLGHRTPGAPRPEAQPRRRSLELFDERFLKTLEHLHMVSRKVFAGNLRAERRTRKVGSGIEFADHRNYARGDDFRYIDWNLYGRLDKLLLRLFEEEEDLSIYILVDCSDSMAIGAPLPKLHYAMQVGAALAYVGLANLDRVAIVPFADRLHRPDAAGARQEPHLPGVRVPAQVRARRPDRARRVHEGRSSPRTSGAGSRS